MKRKKWAGYAFLGLAIALLIGVVMSVNKRTSETKWAMPELTEQEIQAGVFTPEVMWKMGRIGDATLSPDGKLVVYALTHYDMEANKGRTQLWTQPSEGGTPSLLVELKGSALSPQWSGDGKRIYFMCDKKGSMQLWSVSPKGKSLKQLTDVPEGIEAYNVSPTGDHLFYIQSVSVAPRQSSKIHKDMPESKALIYDDLMVRHWDYWDQGSFRHIFVAKVGDNPITEGTDILKDEPWDAPTAPYFDAAEIAWSQDGSRLAYTCKKLKGRDYALSTNTDIYVYDLAQKTTTNVTEGMVGYDKYPRFSPDNNRIAFLSMERAGNEADKNRLMVVDLTTLEKQYLTKDFDNNAEVPVWKNNEELYFVAPIQATQQLCAVSLKDSQVKQLTQGDFDLNSISFANGQLVASLSTLSAANELYSINPNDGSMKQISFVNKTIYDNVKMGKVEKRWIKTTDGKDMLAWVAYPPSFDPNKKYPTLLYCQGGPQSTISQFWSYRWNFQLMASQGYIVVAPNRRGLPSFGQEWLDQISGDYSGQNIKDYLSAIDDMSRESYVDKDRLGCVGASYGGYSVFYLAGHHQKRFKAFIAHCGMFNFESFYGSTEELWFPNNDLGGAYWEDNATAKRSYANSPHKFVKNWDTPILIFVGLEDYRIPYAESLQAFTAARLRGVPSRLVAFENEAHQIFKPQNSLVWNREFFNWLNTYLK